MQRRYFALIVTFLILLLAFCLLVTKENPPQFVNTVQVTQIETPVLSVPTTTQTKATVVKTWDIIHVGPPEESDADVIVVDMFDTSAITIQNLRAQGKEVICYISVGTFEDWRPDAADFSQEVKGNDLGDWEGETWLDIRSEKVRTHMGARFELAREKGCKGIDADNMDGYMNETGSPLTSTDQLAYNSWIAQEAHNVGMTIGLKNTPLLAAALEPLFDFAIVESCAPESCNPFKIFTLHNKPVIQLEYGIADAVRICKEKNIYGFQTIVKDRVITDEEVRCTN
jgi:hypothetical protein